MNKEVMDKEVIVVGAGLAGSEAAYQLAKRGIKVKLYEMKSYIREKGWELQDKLYLVLIPVYDDLFVDLIIPVEK